MRSAGKRPWFIWFPNAGAGGEEKPRKRKIIKRKAVIGRMLKKRLIVGKIPKQHRNNRLSTHSQKSKKFERQNDSTIMGIVADAKFNKSL